MLKFGTYNVCVLDLVADKTTGKLDSAKIWKHIAFIIMSQAMLTNTVTWDLMLAYGSVVGGSQVAIMLIKYKYGGANVSDSKHES